jgi:hypothetical protein
MNKSSCHQGRIYTIDAQEKCTDTNSFGRKVKNGRGCPLAKYFNIFLNSLILNFNAIHLVFFKLLHIFKPVL